jgi:hypothetical protein
MRAGYFLIYHGRTFSVWRRTGLPLFFLVVEELMLDRELVLKSEEPLQFFVIRGRWTG